MMTSWRRTRTGQLHSTDQRVTRRQRGELRRGERRTVGGQREATGELAWRLRTIAESDGVPGLRFKVVERGGRKIVNQLQRTNPTGSPGCSKEDCPVCKQPGGGGGGCHKSNITYQYTCKKDGAVYTGETGRNLYTRGLEHLDKYEKKAEKSFIHAHQIECHDGAPAEFATKVTGSYRDPLSRQVAEAVLITRSSGSTNEVLNSKSEFRQPPIVRVRREINVGI